MTLDEYEAMQRMPKPTAPAAARSSGKLLPCVLCVNLLVLWPCFGLYTDGAAGITAYRKTGQVSCNWA